MVAVAQEPAPVISAALAANPAPAAPSGDAPGSRRWEFGPFVNYGNGLIDR